VIESRSTSRGLVAIAGRQADEQAAQGGDLGEEELEAGQESGRGPPLVGELGELVEVAGQAAELADGANVDDGHGAERRAARRGLLAGVGGDGEAGEGGAAAEGVALGEGEAEEQGMAVAARGEKGRAAGAAGERVVGDAEPPGEKRSLVRV
jgi:hypothetical protein